MIRSRCVVASGLAVMIKPPLARRTKVATARSISPLSRTFTALSSTPKDGATVWMAANWPIRLRRKIEALLLPAEVEIVLQLDGLAERERHRRQG
jgi:hypothetical protein